MKSWQSVKKTHDHAISTKLRVDVDLPKHVEDERVRLGDVYAKSGNHLTLILMVGYGVELEHWKITQVT